MIEVGIWFAVSRPRQDASNPSSVLRMSKKLIREAQHARLETVLELSAALQSIAQHSEEYMTTLNNFLPKR